MNPQDEIIQLKARIDRLENQLKLFIYPTNYRFPRPVNGGPNGLKLLTATTDKLGFYGTAPVAQYSTALNGSAGASYGGTEQNMLNAHNALLIYYGLAHA